MPSINQIWNNDQLYGHCFTSLPKKLWDFTTSNELFLYHHCNPAQARRVFWIVEEYREEKEERWPNGNLKQFEIVHGSNILPFKYLELAFRRLGGAFFYGCVLLTIAPIGFAIKLIHQLGNTLVNRRAVFA